jgi:hypothetical protein
MLKVISFKDVQDLYPAAAQQLVDIHGEDTEELEGVLRAFGFIVLAGDQLLMVPVDAYETGVNQQCTAIWCEHEGGYGWHCCACA